MREIIFRGKRIENGEWVYGYYVYIGPVSCRIACIIPEYASAVYALEVDHTTVGQYTGLRDKNGECIFEGDVLTVDGEDGFFVLEFQEDTARFVMSGDCMVVDFDNFWSYEVEVVGNRVDSSELLEVNEND